MEGILFLWIFVQISSPAMYSLSRDWRYLTFNWALDSERLGDYYLNSLNI